MSRAHRRSRLEVYAFSLRDRLPRCRIPLRPADPDAVLDLPAVFTRCYDVGGYDLLIDYTQAPPVELSEAETDLGARPPAAASQFASIVDLDRLPPLASRLPDYLRLHHNLAFRQFLVQLRQQLAPHARPSP